VPLQAGGKSEELPRPASRGAALVLGFFLALLFLGIAEFAALLIIIIGKQELPYDRKYPSPYFVTDAHGIIKAIPSGHYRSSSRRKKDGSVIYDVFYTTDQFGRRLTPAASPEARSRHLIFFGCSFTYGEGVQDTETIPAQAALGLTGYQPHNYGFHGHGTSHMLRKMQSQTLQHEVVEKEGILVYLFLDFHISRVIGSMRWVAGSGKLHPYYDLNARDQVAYEGSFVQGRPFLQRAYERFSKSALLGVFGIDFPPVIAERHIHLTARIIGEARDLYKEQFPLGEFYVVVFPSSLYGDNLIRELKDKDIKILDYSKLFDRHDPKYFLAAEDRHPNALAYEIVARRLAHDLREAKGSRTSGGP
jgi:hypothetical protein